MTSARGGHYDATVVQDGPPAGGTFRAKHLRSNDHLRLWYNLTGDQVLIYLPKPSGGTGATNTR